MSDSRVIPSVTSLTERSVCIILIRYNVLFIKFRSEHSSNTVLCLLRNLMNRSLNRNRLGQANEILPNRSDLNGGCRIINESQLLMLLCDVVIKC